MTIKQMLAAVRAKSRGCKKAIVLINDPTMSALMDPLGIDAHINLGQLQLAQF